MGFFFFCLQGDEMPEPKSMLEATSEANNLASLSESKETYMRGMEEVCGPEKPFINEHVLEIEHLRIRDTALEVFNGRRKMGGEEFSLKYREKLETEINEAFDNFKMANDNKNIFKAANTPITLATVAMLCYVASQILGNFFRAHTGAKIHILSQNSHFHHLNFHKILNSNISIFKKITLS